MLLERTVYSENFDIEYFVIKSLYNLIGAFISEGMLIVLVGIRCASE